MFLGTQVDKLDIEVTRTERAGTDQRIGANDDIAR
jgi:hypothetical protein